MRVINIMFDTLKRNYLNAYEKSDVHTPNFDRLAEKTVQFNNFFAGSLPCMPARRDLHTGRYNFLHRGWGPIEPFDDSTPEILRQNGIYTHLVTDHKHYWRDGGATYHPRYSTYELIRGQEGDSWKARVTKNYHIDAYHKMDEEGKQRKVTSVNQDFVNRSYMPTEKEHTMARTFEAGFDFLENNVTEDQWFLQIESFDPHEPFFVPEKYLNMYGLTQDDFDGWLIYSHDDFSAEKSALVKKFYQALMTMCDAYLGKVIDFMDEHHMWEDTMLIVNTDHGLLLGEHEWWGKNIMPIYNEVAHLPFFIWYPQLEKSGEEVNQLAQTIDIPATILDFFDIELPENMKGKPLRKIIEDGEDIHEAGLFGVFGGILNITDAEYVYMRAPVPGQEHQLNEYTLMPTRINRRFMASELDDMSLTDAFTFTKGVNVLKVPMKSPIGKEFQRFGHKLFHYQSDPKQEQPILNAMIEWSMIQKMKQLMMDNEAPESLYRYYGLDQLHSVEDVRQEQQRNIKVEHIELDGITLLNQQLKEAYLSVYRSLENQKTREQFREDLSQKANEPVTKEDISSWIKQHIEVKKQAFLLYQLEVVMRVD